MVQQRTVQVVPQVVVLFTDLKSFGRGLLIEQFRLKDMQQDFPVPFYL